MRRGRTAHIIIPIAGLSIAAAMLAACGGAATAGRTATVAPSVAAPTASAATGGKATVRTTESAGDPRTAWKFDPAEVTVRQGESVVFVNAGKEAHTATADDGTFDAGTLNPGESKSVRFDRPGSTSFHCSLHPWMTGRVIVVAATGGSYSNSSSY